MRTIAPLTCCLLLFATSTVFGESFAAWLCRVLGLNSVALASGSTIRADVRLRGNRLVTYNWRDKTQPKELWAASGLHSPTLLPSRGIIVMRSSEPGKPELADEQTGVWLVPLDGSPASRLVPGRFIETLGVFAGTNQVLIAGPANPGADGVPKYRLWKLDPDAPERARLSEEPTEVSSGDLGAFRAGQILGDQCIRERLEKAEPTSAFRIAKLPISGATFYEEVAPPGNHSRFYPIWIDTSTISYVEKFESEK